MAGLSAACDWWVDYTVVNETGQELVTFGLYAPCHTRAKYRDDYLGAEHVASHSSYRYEGRTGANVECAKVTTLDRQVVIEEAPTMGAIFQIREPLALTKGSEPDPGSLPRRTPWQNFRNQPLSFQILGPVSTAILLLLMVVIVRAVVGRIRELTRARS
jgi:hypothetical protein